MDGKVNNLYNLEYLKEISGDDVFIMEMLGSFIKTAPRYFYKIKRHFVNRNLKAILEEIHRFKNTAAYIGNNNLLKELTDLENAIVTGPKLLKCRKVIINIDLLILDIINQLKYDFNLK